MDVWLRAIMIVICTVLGSGGFWAYLRSKDTRSDATTSLMMGLAYVQITTLGLQYIERGSITTDEYEDLDKYFYKPYVALGGNGVAKRIMRDVSNLPLRSHNEHAEIFRNNQNEGFINNVRLVTPNDRQASAE